MPDSIKIFEKYSQRYDNWYKEGEGSVLGPLEYKAIKQSYNFSSNKTGVEIGIGSGYFSKKLNIQYGIDPAFNQLILAQQKGITTIAGIAEKLPFKDKTFDFTLLVVTLCFVDNPNQTIKEAYRILKGNGTIITAIVPAETPWGKFYIKKQKTGHLFYEKAVFFTKNEIVEMLENNGFSNFTYTTTLFQNPSEKPTTKDKIINQHDNKGGFLVITGEKAEA